MESKINQYRDSEADKLLAEDCQVNNHCHDCCCAALEEGYKEGFDAALALDLPIKFAEWKDQLTPLIPEHFKIMMPEAGKSRTRQELYTYWIENVYKLK